MVRAGDRDGLQGIGHRSEMLLGQMQIPDGVFQFGMSQQGLNGAQVRTRFEQVGSPTVTQSVRRAVLRNAGSLGGLATGLPRDFVADGDPRASSLPYLETGRSGASSSASIRAGLQQFGAERHVAIAATLACPNVNELAWAVDIADLQTAQLGSSYPRRIERHQHGTV
jgi:hypothetical protein